MHSTSKARTMASVNIYLLVRMLCKNHGAQDHEFSQYQSLESERNEWLEASKIQRTQRVAMTSA